ncbi:MAG TPA: ABC transporter ATP-binding protein [Candidatus Peribacteraceae bacterium]|nr:ABC transporter ATP-binding protein [Candidatus Peribacteraceae bacterium]
MDSPIPNKPLSFGLFATKPFWPWMAGAAFSVISASTLDGLTNVILKKLVDAMTSASTVANADFGSVWYWAILYTAVFSLGGFLWRCSGFCGMQWITKTRVHSYNVLFSYLTHHSARYFSNRFAGALTNKISNVAEGIANIFQNLLWQFLPLVIILGVGLYTAALASPLFSGLLLLWSFLYLIVNVTLVAWKRKYSVALALHTSELRGAMVDSATNISAVQQSAHQEYEIEHLGSYLKNFRASALKNWFLSEWILVSGNVLQMIFVGGMLALAVVMLQRHQITVGDVAMIISLMIQMIRQIFFIGNQMNQFMDSFGQATEGLQELLQPHEIVDRPSAAHLSMQQGSVEFRHVEFSYGTQPVFHDFTLDIPAGQKVGLVGHSGAGKTSLTSILLRQYDIQSGEILIDGQNIGELTQKSLRNHIAIVPQDTSLFHRSIRENIRYGRLDASDADVQRAAELAQAHPFIERLTDGYDTLVGERGVKLSGGQRQRIAVARAILKNAPILVLDEATSALDSESEHLIQQALTELMKGKTVLAIAHRLSTLRMMDRIIVLDKGIVIEDGTHDELLAKKGMYARLWESQVKGFIQE